VALWRRSSPTTVRLVLFLSAAALALGVIFIRQHRRSSGAVDHSAEVAAVPPAAMVAPRDAPAPAAPVAAAPAPRTETVKLTARSPLLETDPPDIARARSALARGDALTARRIYCEALKGGLSSTAQQMVRGELIRLADGAIFSPDVLAEDGLVSLYPVGRGDTLMTIARRFKITDDLILSINRIPNKDRLSVGTPLKVVKGPFRAIVTKSDFRLDVFLGEVLVRSFRAGLGTNGSTPTGRWIVRDKLRNPGWTDPRTNEYYHPDAPDNPIGEFWIGLEGVAGDAVSRRGFGIHGTIDPGSIGRQMSLGCVRLLPQDIESVFRLLVIGESTVEIVD